MLCRWAHVRGAAEPHQLHFDMDETQLRRGRRHYARRHPVRRLRLWGPATPSHALTTSDAIMLLVLSQCQSDLMESMAAQP